MGIVCFILSIISVCLCVVTYWAIPIDIASLIVSMVMFYKYFLSEKRNEHKKFRGLVFAGFVLSLIALIGTFMMISVGIPVATLLTLQK